MPAAIGVDIGGTKVAGGVVDDEGRILARCRRPTPGSSPDDIAEAVASVVAELRRDHGDAPVGIGAAGLVDADRSRVVFAPNLVWRDEPLRDRLTKVLGLDVVVENDGNSAAWAEARFGAGRGQAHLVCLTIGTGIGGGIVLDGRLVRGRSGMSGEFGHMTLVPGGRRCGCEHRGCFEQYCSGRALLREARELADVQPRVAARLLALGGGRPEGITAPAVTQAANEGDPAAIECFRVIGSALGRGLASLAAAFDPGMFVIGGGVAEAGPLLLGPARTSFAETLTGAAFRPEIPIRAAELGSEAGLVGAADLARQA